MKSQSGTEMSQRMEKSKKDWNSIFPGRSVTIAPDVIVKVYPPGIVHIKEFSTVLMRLADQISKSSLSTVKKPDGSVGLAPGAAGELINTILPVVLTELFDLLNLCVDIDLTDPNIPHSVLPKLAIAWIEESFLKEDSINPWMQAIETIVEKMTGKKTNLWAIWSRISSPADSNTTTSLSDTNMASHTEVGA